MTPPDKFVFVEVNAGESAHTKGLRISSVRSHAALITHQKIRASNRRPPPPRSNTDTPTSLDGAPVVAKAQPFRRFRVHRPSSPPTSPDKEEDTYEYVPAPGPRLLEYYPISPPESPDSGHYSDNLELTTSNREVDEQREPAYEVNTRYIKQVEPTHDQGWPFAPQSPSISDLFSGFRTDPFHCIPGSVDTRVASTIDFYAQHLSPGNDAVCYVFDVTNIYAWFLDALAVGHFYDAGMSVVQGLHDDVRAIDPSTSPQVLTHRGKAMAKVRQRILKDAINVDDSTVIAMIFLAVLERSFRNTSAHELHKKNLQMIVSKRGGLKAFQDGSLVKGAMLQFDTLWSLDSGKTIFPGERRQHDPELPSHPYSPELCKVIESFPPGFEALALEGVLSYDVIPLVYRAAHLARLSPSARWQLLSTKRRLPGQYNDFAEACPSLAISGRSGSMLEKLIATAILCFAYTGFGSRTSASALRGSRAELLMNLHLYNPKSVAEADCLLWMYVVAVDAWSVGSRLQPDGLVLLVKLQEGYPATRSVDAAITMARRFLWTSLLDESVRSYWKDLVSND
ncbi:uncharacterized protein A1O9_06010 [Exophiala aquamarina CBS 119918]|uniref:Transcription factor domain-containing protein n=1 Tax=Exophiala aquamarina CBS 119918 TaxID=1182545 RepID=A0A072PE85_9EURO|nr:uncharacterized protein A1O9_06010 [Exophiala aquamarina CBS 119918]KEF58087.1 hypothetical protein A1O9_06010 [Exophiala aquamarina CBS 119918]